MLFGAEALTLSASPVFSGWVEMPLLTLLFATSIPGTQGLGARFPCRQSRQTGRGGISCSWAARNFPICLGVFSVFLRGSQPGESQTVHMSHLHPNRTCLLGPSPSPSPTPAQASWGQSSHTLCAFCCASPFNCV